MRVSERLRNQAARFRSGEIETSTFRHGPHVEIAAAMLAEAPFLEVALAYGRQIEAMASAAGHPEKFNLTITLAFLSVIAERMHDAGEEDVETFLAANPALMDKALLSRWYSDVRLRSPLARAVLLLPEAGSA